MGAARPGVPGTEVRSLGSGPFSPAVCRTWWGREPIASQRPTSPRERTEPRARPAWRPRLSPRTGLSGFWVPGRSSHFHAPGLTPRSLRPDTRLGSFPPPRGRRPGPPRRRNHLRPPSSGRRSPGGPPRFQALTWPRHSKGLWAPTGALGGGTLDNREACRPPAWGRVPESVMQRD